MIRRAVLIATATLCLAGCGGGGTPSNSPPIGGTPAPPPSPPPPTSGPRSYNVTNCLTQNTPTGLTVAQLVIPDVLTIDFSLPSGFPNGRALPDPVIDRILALLFLNLRVHSINTLANVPVNPASNDRPFRVGFPYLAPPQGSPPRRLGEHAARFRSALADHRRSRRLRAGAAAARPRSPDR